jgi:hypothetical protein
MKTKENSYVQAAKESVKIAEKIKKLELKKKKLFKEEADLYKSFMKAIKFLTSDDYDFKTLKDYRIKIGEIYENQIQKISKILK